MEHEKTMLESLKEILSTEEGRDDCRRFFQRIENKENIQMIQMARFYAKYGYNVDKLNGIISKIFKKYSSNEYYRRSFTKGYEPIYELYWFLYHYAKAYGTRTTKKKYLNMFTRNREAFIIGNYVLSAMDGQGSVINIRTI